MHRLLSGVLSALFGTLAIFNAVAQDTPLAEVTGSYQFDHLTLSADGVSASANISRGWDGSVNIPIRQWFGMVGDVGGIWKSESELFSIAGTTISASGTSSLYTFGGGPQVTYRKSYVQPFARFILGDAHSTGSASVNSTFGNFSGSASVDSFFIAPGGGADFRITHNVWLRGGADYFRTSKYNETVNGIRAFVGITFTFGGRGASAQQQEPSTDSQPRHNADSGMQVSTLGIRVVGEGTGARIVYLDPNGVAGKSGLHFGDVIDAVDGSIVKGPRELVAQIASRVPGAKVRIGYLLRGEWQTEIVVTVGESR